MASTRQSRDAFASNMQESMGVRQAELRPVLAPAPVKKDAGRRPLRNVGKLAIAARSASAGPKTSKNG